MPRLSNTGAYQYIAFEYYFSIRDKRKNPIKSVPGFVLDCLPDPGSNLKA